MYVLPIKRSIDWSIPSVYFKAYQIVYDTKITVIATVFTTKIAIVFIVDDLQSKSNMVILVSDKVFRYLKQDCSGTGSLLKKRYSLRQYEKPVDAKHICVPKGMRHSLYHRKAKLMEQQADICPLFLVSC